MRQPGSGAFDAAKERIEACAGAAQGARILVAIAGPPGVGKSTLSERLRESFNAAAPDCCEIVPMDGFHYDDRVLEARGQRARKGAPYTFDAEGLHVLLRRLKDAAAEVAVPVFDRDLEIARAGARIVGPQVRIVLVEGNYLLLDDSRWAPLRAFFDLTILLDAPMAEIERRLAMRWAGLAEPQRRIKLEGNDLPNAREVVRRSVAPDLRLCNAD